ncbi:response regulator transcription factor [Neobacillus citreus]|uniref:Response regulator transcription factor n=1 Tax=Neobacillus citreus TaxID=2833578 RepID=A0A942Y618_9BACI|nr:response regulator transcription factor [Neobacillus citreus]MCH6266806.1 response regulator transcription factor [Neobacillus citreus]
MINILLVDDHPLVGEGTKLIIENEQDMIVHFETSCRNVFDRIQNDKFEVMLFDLQMPEIDGFELTKQVLKIVPAAKILIYTGFDILPHWELFIESGAVGFVSKTATKEQLIRAIRCALNREVVIPYSFLKELVRKGHITVEKNASGITILNDREKEIIQELAKGKTNRDIAQALFIGQRSLEYSLTNIFQKLGVQTRVEAVVKASELGLIIN